MTRTIAIFVAVLSVVTSGRTAGSCETVETEGIVGTWRLVEFTNYRNGEKVQPFGTEPLGYMIYTPSGHVSVQTLHNPPPESFSDLDLTREERRGLRQASYSGYFGTYEVDEERSVVIHHVEGGVHVFMIERDEERPFRIEGNKLIIGRDGEYERILVRVPEE